MPATPFRRLLGALLAALVLGTSACHGQAPAKARTDQATATGQPKLVRTLGTTPYVNIHCSVLDPAGNLWFDTTGEGVYRYDGTTFTQFTEREGLSSNTVWCALADRSGTIWFGTDNGLCRYDGKAMTRVPIPLTSGVSFLTGSVVTGSAPTKNAVYSLMQDKAGQLWFGTSAGVYRSDGTTFTRFLDTPGLLNPTGLRLKDVQCMLQDPHGDIWFGSGPMAFEGLCRYDGHALTPVKLEKETWVRYLLADRKGGIWIGTRHLGAWHYDGKRLTRFRADTGPNPTTADIGLPLLVDKAGKVWLNGGEDDNGYGGAGGIWRYDGRAFTNFTPKDGLGDYSVWSMVEDRAGNIWVGTRNVGLYRYDGKKFTRFSE